MSTTDMRPIFELCKEFNVVHLHMASDGSMRVRFGPAPVPEKSRGELEEEKALSDLDQENLPWLAGGLKPRKLR